MNRLHLEKLHSDEVIQGQGLGGRSLQGQGKITKLLRVPRIKKRRVVSDPAFFYLCLCATKEFTYLLDMVLQENTVNRRVIISA